MISFKNKVVWVTGSSTGIGRETVLSFAKLGADVVVHGFGDQENGQEVVEKAESLGVKALLVDGDVSVKKEVERIANEVKEAFGRVDVLVNNVGAYITIGNIEDLAESDWDKIIDVNLKSVFLVTQAALPLIKNTENGRIINVTSDVERTGGTTFDLAYTAAKGGVSAITRALAKKLVDYNIQVNAVAPGLTDTPFHKNDAPFEKYQQHINERIPMKRPGKPEDIAGAILFLASTYSSYITGEIISVIGGRRVS